MNSNIYGISYRKRSQNSFIPNYIYNQPSNDYDDTDLQNRINRSLYPYNKNSQQYKSSTINNISDYDNNSNNYDLFEDFKQTLKKTQNLTAQLMNRSEFSKGNIGNYKKNRNYYNHNLNSDSKVSSEEMDSDDDNYNTEDLEENEEEEDEEQENSLNSDKKFNKDIKRNNNNITQKYDNIKENIQIKTKDGEEKLKLSNQNLKNSNQDLRNENRILEVEILNYKTQENNKKKNNLTNYDENLLSFISSLKQALKDTTKRNTEIVDKIFQYQKSIEETDSSNKKLIEEHKNLADKIEINNRKKAEMQIMNEENEKKINNLEEEKLTLNKELEKLNLKLNDLKGVEKNLKILNDSNLKRKQDNKELITRLKNTVDHLNSEISSLKEKAKMNNKKNKTTENYLNIYDKKILTLENTIKSIDLEKNQYLKENANLNVEIKTKKVGNNKESQQQEIKLKDQLNKIKVENDQLMNKIGEKDIKIQNLKECMDKFEEIKNKGNLQNYEEEVKKLNLDEILTEDDLDDKNNIKDDMNIEEKKIRNEIKKALNENQSKKNEIDKTKQFYTNIIQKKDGIINALESQINIPIDYQNNLQSSNFKPNPNMNINNNIDINNNNEELFIDNNNFNPNEFANEEEQYEQVGEEGEGQNINANNEIHDLDGIGENEGEEGYIDENQYINGQYDQYNQYDQQQQYGQDYNDNDYNEMQMNEEIEGEEGEEQVEYMGDMGDINYEDGNEEYDDKNNLEINDLDI